MKNNNQKKTTPCQQGITLTDLARMVGELSDSVNKRLTALEEAKRAEAEAEAKACECEEENILNLDNDEEPATPAESAPAPAPAKKPAPAPAPAEHAPAPAPKAKPVPVASEIPGGPKKVYKVWDYKSRSYIITQDIWAAKAIDAEYVPVWAWVNNGGIHHLLSAEEITKYLP